MGHRPEPDEDVEPHAVALGVGLDVFADRFGMAGIFKPKVVPEVDCGQADQIVKSLAQRDSVAVEVDVAGRPRFGWSKPASVSRRGRQAAPTGPQPQRQRPNSGTAYASCSHPSRHDRHAE